MTAGPDSGGRRRRAPAKLGRSHWLPLDRPKWRRFIPALTNPDPVAFTVAWGNTTVPVQLIPRKNYQQRIRQLAKTRGIIPTTILRFQTADLSGEALTDFITDVCHALSIIQGGKVNWIYHATYGRKRAFQHAVFGNTITKSDTTQPLCFIPTIRSAVTLPLTAARETLPFVKHFRETFDSHNRLINAWLDARTPTDYLEARTLKYVVVIEALDALTLRTDKTIAKTVRDSSVWKELYRKHIAPALPADAATWLTLSNWQRLNERSFRDTLEAVCHVHGITLPLKDVSLFGSVRNAIVHRFDYNSAIQLPSQWIMPHHVQAAQHFFAAEFVDRIILQLFGLRAYLKSIDAG